MLTDQIQYQVALAGSVALLYICRILTPLLLLRGLAQHGSGS